MENRKSQNVNVICPAWAKSFLLETQAYPKAHWFSLEDVVRALVADWNDEGILGYAQANRIGFSQAKSLFSSFAYLKPQAPKDLDFGPIKTAYRQREKAMAQGFLKSPDSLGEWGLRMRPIVIVGYPNGYGPLVRLLGDHGFKKGTGKGQYSFVLTPSFDRGTTLVYPQAWEEVFMGFDALRQAIAKALTENQAPNGSDFAIVCPEDYDGLVSQMGELFQIPVSIPFSQGIDLPPVAKMIADFKAGDSRCETFLNGEGKTPLFQSLSSAVYEALSLLAAHPELDADLKAEYLKNQVSRPVRVVSRIGEVPVYHDLASLGACRFALVLGFSDALMASFKDDGAIPDKYKARCSYLPTAVEENQASLISLQGIAGQAKEIRFSRSEVAFFSNYRPSLAIGAIPGFKETRPTQLSITSFAQGGSHPELTFYSALRWERWDRLQTPDPMLSQIAQIAPKSLDAYASYDNQFDSDPVTQDYFRKRLGTADDDHPLVWSHSSLDTYLANPFSFFVERFLGIHAPTTLSSLRGTLVHAYLEEGEAFDFEKKAKEFMDAADGDLDGICPQETLYFLKKAYENAKAFVYPRIYGDLKTNVDMSLVKPQGVSGTFNKPGSETDEFGFGFEILPGVQAKGSYDAIFKVGEDEGLIVDFKTGSNLNVYFSPFNALNGRTLQLPLYLLFFKGAKQGREELKGIQKILGAFVCQAIDWKWKDIEKDLMIGFQVDGRALGTESNNLLTRKDDISQYRGQSKSQWKGVLGQFVRFYQEVFAHNDISALDGLYDQEPYLNADSMSDLLLKIAKLAILNSTWFVRNGRLSDGKGNVIWFPVFPAMIKGFNSRWTGVGIDTFDDISFARPEQSHNINLFAKPSAYRMDHFDFDPVGNPFGYAAGSFALDSGEDDADSDDQED